MFISKQNLRLFLFIVLVLSTNGETENRTIYILIWTYTNYETWMYQYLDYDSGQHSFERRNCSFQNCHFTTNRGHFNSVADYDVLVFNTIHITPNYPKELMPTQRSEAQLYVLYSSEPAAYKPIPDMFNGVFNLTWTYLLKSDIVNPYFFVKNKVGEIIGPKIDPHWVDIKNMLPLHSVMVNRLRHKRLAALWVVSNCRPKKRWVFVENLNKELSKYGYQVDIMGKCGDETHCQEIVGERTGLLTSCFANIELDYYFYLAFENSFSEDYVSEKVLHGLLHYMVPIVYGGANYTRFLPNGTYLNALELGVDELAREMVNIMNSPERYYDFFKFHSYYNIHDPNADDRRETVCALCAYLNNKTNRNKSKVYENITEWWNAPYSELLPKNLHKSVYSYKTQTVETEAPPEAPNQLTVIVSKIIDFFLDYT